MAVEIRQSETGPEMAGHGRQGLDRSDATCRDSVGRDKADEERRDLAGQVIISFGTTRQSGHSVFGSDMTRLSETRLDKASVAAPSKSRQDGARWDTADEVR
jgi:hypothetical protein